MTPAEMKQAITRISGSMAQFSRDYDIPYRTVQNWCLKATSPTAEALVREIQRAAAEKQNLS